MLSFYVYTRDLSELLFLLLQCFHWIFYSFSKLVDVSLIKCIHLEYWCVFDGTEETLVLLHPYKVRQTSEKFSPQPQLIVCVQKITFEDLMKPSSICTLRVNPGGG